MKRLVAFSLMIALVGCGGANSRSDPTTAVTSTTFEVVAPTTTTAPVLPSTSTTTADEGSGSKAISVTETITITITDPEGG